MNKSARREGVPGNRTQWNRVIPEAVRDFMESTKSP